MKLYEKWKNIQKTIPSKRSDTQKKAANTFFEELDDLFDISTSMALEEIRIDEDRQFLIQQRQKGCPACMAGVDMTLYAREKRSNERKEMEQSRKKRYEETTEQSNELNLLPSAIGENLNPRRPRRILRAHIDISR